MVIPEAQLTFINRADGSCEVSFIAADNSVAIKLTLSRLQAAALNGKLNASPSVNLNGTIYVSIDSDELELPIAKAVAIDELVIQAVHPDMLEDEPEAENMLAEFRSCLLKSLAHVDNAIASLPKR
jgi:hypothetical protein